MYTKVQAVPLIEKWAVWIDIDWQRGLFQETEHLHNTTEHMIQPPMIQAVKKAMSMADSLAQAVLYQIGLDQS